VTAGGDAFEALLAQRGGDVLVLVDERLRIVRAGAEAAALADRAEGRLEGLSIIAAFGSAALDAVAREALSAGRPVRGEADLGALGARQFAVDAVPLDAGGLVLSLHDVTVLRRIERVRRDFVANISHELRTPLSSIKLLAETLSSGSVDDATTTRDFAAQIEREVDHLAQLVDELLDLSRIESGETQLALEAVTAEAAADDCIERIGPVALRREISVVKQPIGAPARVMADSGRLGQALLNLAHNAVKYSHPGGTVRIGWEVLAGAVRFLVADDGAGVPAAHQARVFERFYKVDRSRARPSDGDDQLTGSAGLGLAIVRHIAEAHGGSVGLTSAEGAGSTFWVEVPLAQ
jgi:two-component system, OmpR family, phosphate regulon sensor histidine kinase PhoR